MAPFQQVMDRLVEEGLLRKANGTGTAVVLRVDRILITNLFLIPPVDVRIESVIAGFPQGIPQRGIPQRGTPQQYLSH